MDSDPWPFWRQVSATCDAGGPDGPILLSSVAMASVTGILVALRSVALRSMCFAGDRAYRTLGAAGRAFCLPRALTNTLQRLDSAVAYNRHASIEMVRDFMEELNIALPHRVVARTAQGVETSRQKTTPHDGLRGMRNNIANSSFHIGSYSDMRFPLVDMGDDG